MFIKVIKTTITKKNIKDFLRRLLKECKREDTYSVIKKVEEMGVSYTRALRLIIKSEDLENLLDECNAYCYDNIETAFAVKDISFDEGWAGLNETSARAWRHRCRTSEKYRKEWRKKKQEDKEFERQRILEEKERRGEEIICKKRQVTIGGPNGKKKESSYCKPQ